MAVLATNKIEWMPDAQMPQAEGGWSGDDECLSLEGMNNSGPDGSIASWPLGRMLITPVPPADNAAYLGSLEKQAKQVPEQQRLCKR